MQQRNNPVDDEVLKELPDSVKALVGMIGMENAIKLCQQQGGYPLEVPERETKMRIIMQAQIADAIGDKMAERVITIFAGQGKVYLPSLDALRRKARDRLIVQDYDQNGYNIRELVMKYQLSHKTIEKVLKRTTLPERGQFSLSFGGDEHEL